MQVIHKQKLGLHFLSRVASNLLLCLGFLRIKTGRIFSGFLELPLFEKANYKSLAGSVIWKNYCLFTDYFKTFSCLLSIFIFYFFKYIVFLSGCLIGAGYHQSEASAGEADCHHGTWEDALVSWDHLTGRLWATFTQQPPHQWQVSVSMVVHIVTSKFLFFI